jgi:rubrerythrin
MKTFNCVNDVLDLAIAREIEAHDFYVELAAWAERPEVAAAFEELAAQEAQHRTKLEAVKAGHVTLEEQEVGSLGIAETLDLTEPKANLTYLQALGVAMQREEDAFGLYTHLASMARDRDVKAMLSKLAQEEAQHRLQLEIEYDLTVF